MGDSTTITNNTTFSDMEKDSNMHFSVRRRRKSSRSSDRSQNSNSMEICSCMLLIKDHQNHIRQSMEELKQMLLTTSHKVK